jgi:hypothetical protein
MTHDTRGVETSRALDDGDILALVQSESRRLDRRIRRRDARELIAAAIGGLLIAPGMFRGPLLSRIGAAIVICGLVVIAVRLARARNIDSAASDASLSVVAALEAELRRVDAQIALLESVLWWYVAPVLAGAFMIVAGSLGASRITLAYGVAVMLLAWGIVALNARAARRVLHPRRAELCALLAQFDDVPLDPDA